MTRVDFYVTSDDSEAGRLRIACRLAEKAYTSGQKVHVHTGNPRSASELDKAMWTFRDGSFIPHAIIDDALTQEHEDNVPVRIGATHTPLEDVEILINLDQAIPEFFSRMNRVLEIVGGDTKSRDAARERFKFYRDRGYDLNSHNV